MKTEAEIKEHYDMLTPLKPILHPALFLHLEWILEIGDKKNQDMIFNLLKQISDDKLKKEWAKEVTKNLRSKLQS